MSLGELIIMNLEHQLQRVDVHMHLFQDILRILGNAQFQIRDVVYVAEAKTAKP